LGAFAQLQLGGADGIELRESSSKRLVRRFEPRADAPGFARNADVLQFSPGGDRLLAGVVDDIFVWEVNSGRELIRISQPYYEPTWSPFGGWSACFSPDGSKIAFAQQRWIYLWDFDEDRPLAKLGTADERGRPVGDYVRGVVWLDNQPLASAAGERVSLWSLESLDSDIQRTSGPNGRP
jgi:Tol biopolymer transport system component